MHMCKLNWVLGAFCMLQLQLQLHTVAAGPGGAVLAACSTPDAASQAQPTLPRGVVSVVDTYGADPTGKTDSTSSLQRAMVDARTQNISLFLPQGCYMVTDTLNATQPRNGRWQAVVLFGQRPVAGGRPPTLFLPPRTAGFTDGHVARPVMLWITNWCLEPGPLVGLAAKGCASADQPKNDWHSSAYQFNQALVGVDVVLGEGNPGAVGIDMNAAQGSTLENVGVYADGNALAGIAGGNGGGGSFKGVTVVGAKYGIDMRTTGSSPTYVAITLINQTCAAVLQLSASTATVTGLRVEGSPALAAVLAGVNPSTLENTACSLLPPTPGAGALTDPEGPSPNNALHSATSIVDSGIVLGSDVPCFLAVSSLYLSDVYTSGCSTVVSAAGRAPVPSVPGKGFSHVTLLAFGRLPPVSSPYTFAFPSYVNGKRKESVVTLKPSGPPPADLQSKHLWSGAGAGWQSAGAVNALHVGAVGDGIKDDWQALQAAVDKHSVVVLPKGFYRLSKPLQLRRAGGALVGVGKTVSFLMSSSEAAFGEQALLDIVGDDVTVGFLTVATWDHLDARMYALHWRGDEGIWRQAFFNRLTESTFPPFSSPGAPQLEHHTGTLYGRALSVISGGGKFYDYNLDFGCCFGGVVPAGVLVPPDTSSSNETLLMLPGYRTLLVNGSIGGVGFYPLNAEQDFGDAHTEIRWSRNVSMFGAKSENNYVVIWIRDSDNVKLHGYGGNASPFSNKTAYGPGFPGGPGGYAQYMPSSFRVQRSTNVRLANLVDAGRWTTAANPSVFVAAGNGTDPRTWNMILRQDQDALCDPLENPSGGECSATAVLDRPVLWEWTGEAMDSDTVGQ